jgi:hypothetical protein
MAKMFVTLEEAKTILATTDDQIKSYVRDGRLREFRDGPRLMFKGDQVTELAASLGCNSYSDPQYKVGSYCERFATEKWRSGEEPLPPRSFREKLVDAIKGAGGSAAPEPEKNDSSDTHKIVNILYTNWKGVTAVRRIVPIYIWWGSTPWHKEDQHLLKAHDVEKGEERDFAMKDIRSWYV